MADGDHLEPGWLVEGELKSSLDTITKIVEIDDEFRRSYVITQAYADVSWAIAELLPTPKAWPPGDDNDAPADANFWTFLTWSARSLTLNIRSTRPRLGNGGLRPGARARRFLTPLAMQALARGQEDAFNECARIGVTLYHEMHDGDGAGIDAGAVVAACIDQLPGRLISVRDENDLVLGVTKLVEAVKLSRTLARYADLTDDERRAAGLGDQAGYKEHVARRSQLILAASIALDAAEQKLVQRPLEEAFHAVPNQLLGLSRDPVHSRNHPGGRRLTRAAARRIAPVFRDTSARFTTDWIFSVALPTHGDEVVKLGRDLPLYRSGKRFPPALDKLVDEDLRKLIGRFDDSYANGSGTAAKNWTIYDDRMSFIVNYLRLYQQQIEPAAKPFEPYQSERLREHRYPWLEPGEDAQLLNRILASVAPEAGPKRGEGPDPKPGDDREEGGEG